METTKSFALTLFNVVLVTLASVCGIISVASWSNNGNVIFNTPWSYAEASTDLLGTKTAVGVAMGLRSFISYTIIGDITAVLSLDEWSACASDSGSPADLISMCTECRDAGSRVVASGCLGIISALLMFLCLTLACLPCVKTLANCRLFNVRIATFLGLISFICFLVGFISYQSCFSAMKMYYLTNISSLGGIKMGLGQGLGLGAFLFFFFAMIIDRTNNVLAEAPLAAAEEKSRGPTAPGQLAWM
jgi:hypothetical protein